MRHYWGSEETAALITLAGDLPWPDLVKRWPRMAAANGWPPRTTKALAVKVAKLGLSGRARQGDWLTTYGLADLLGVSQPRIRRWLRKPAYVELLQPRLRRRVTYLQRRALRRFAVAHPHEWAGIPSERLLAALEDQDLADAIATAHPLRPGDYRIRCVESGELFDSAAAAGRAHHVDHSTIGRALRHCGGHVASVELTFERLRWST